MLEILSRLARFFHFFRARKNVLQNLIRQLWNVRRLQSSIFVLLRLLPYRVHSHRGLLRETGRHLHIYRNLRIWCLRALVRGSVDVHKKFIDPQIVLFWQRFSKRVQRCLQGCLCCLHLFYFKINSSSRSIYWGGSLWLWFSGFPILHAAYTFTDIVQNCLANS